MRFDSVPARSIHFQTGSGAAALTINASNVLTLGAPLPFGSGGTGTSSIGTPGQYAIVNAGGTGYSFTAGPGGGGVTSVGLAVNSAFSGFATISTSSSNPIVNTGILTIDMLANPVIDVATTSNITTLRNLGSGGDLGIVNLLAPNLSINTTSRVWLGKTPDFTGGAAFIQYSQAASLTDGFNALVIGVGASSNLSIRNNGTSTLSGTLAVTGSLSSTTITASGLITANAGLNSTTITASGLVSANAGLSATSTATNGIDLSANVSLGIRATTSNTSVGAITLNVVSAATNSVPIRFGNNNDTGNSGNLSFTYNGTGLATNSLSLGFTGGTNLFTMFNSASTAATLLSPLTVSGLLTGNAGVTSTTITASTKIVCPTFETGAATMLHELLNIDSTFRVKGVNVDLQIAGGTAGTTNADMAVVSGTFFSTSAVANDFVLRAPNNLHFQSGTGASAITIEATTNNVIIRNNLTVSGTLNGAPKYGNYYLAGDQTITGSLNTTVSPWTASTSGPLILGGGGGFYLQNTSGSTVNVMVSYSILWDPAVLGGAVKASVRNDVGAYLITSYASVFSAGGLATCTGQNIVTLVNNAYFFMEVRYDAGTPLNIKGGGPTSINVSRMSYYILN